MDRRGFLKTMGILAVGSFFPNIILGVLENLAGEDHVSVPLEALENHSRHAWGNAYDLPFGTVEEIDPLTQIATVRLL